jgi:hypothetical protein
MSNLFDVSQSKLETFRRCRRAYSNKYIRRLRRKGKARPLEFGTLVHQMLDAYAEGDDPFSVLDNIPANQRRLFASEREELGDIIEDVRTIMAEYFTYWAERPQDEIRYVRIAKKSAEHNFKVEIAPGIAFNGKIDGVVRAKGLRWTLENKTFTNLPSDDHRWRNLQSIVYFRAMEILGWPDVDGTLWNYVHSKRPPRPQLLKNGKLSTKKLKTLPSGILAAIDEHGLLKRDYSTMLESAKTTRSEWFKRIFTPIKRRAVDIVVRDFIETANEMADLHGKRQAMTIGRHCEWCEYSALCRAELTGGDVDYVIDKEYTEKERRPARDPQEFIHQA